jgi:hypothetical protein
MSFIYRVRRRDNPNLFVELEFEESQTPMRVKDRACREHYYPWEAYTKLVVKRVRVDIPRVNVKETEADE